MSGVTEEKNEISERSEGSSTATSIAKASRHENHWYLDGSIVIHMQGTLFRLHRSALVRKSKYFSRLFEEVGDGERLEKISGCPVVHVKGNPDDFAVLLDAIDDGVYVVSFFISLLPEILKMFSIAACSQMRRLSQQWRPF